MNDTINQETHRFETEVEQLLHLMVNSLYSNKEIFLRELISNAADACDKLRFEALKDSALYENNPDLAVTVAYDRDARTVTVSDNGIGMSREEVAENIGTIARSGTRRFLDSMTGEEAKDARLIGQFGVGFYSVFIVADQVTLTTRRAGMTQGVRWSSDGQGEYTLADDDRSERGTTVTLHLKEGEDEFLDGWRLRGIIRRYSDHIDLPIRMAKETEEKDAAPDMETVNRAAALWTRPRTQISDEDYKAFYKSVTHDVEDPLAWIHNRVEGKLEYTSLLYIPKRAPFDLWDPERRRGVKLYVRRIFIMDDAEHLMPGYLRFVRGVVDSADLPLNVSRELLQSNRAIDVMRAGSVKKLLGLLEGMAGKEPEKYATFWKEFGRVLKEGPAEDATNREKIAQLLRFASTHTDSDAQTVALKDYINRMKPDQNAIYYLTADSFTAAKHSPHLEMLRKNDIEVLLLYERVDEWLMSHLTEFDGKSFKSVSKGELEAGELTGRGAAKPEDQEDQESGAFLERVKDALGGRVEAVRASQRLTDSPACVVAAQDAIGLNLQRLLQEAGQPVPESRPILELNLTHTLVERVRAEADQSRFRQWTELLLDQAVLAEGGQLQDPARFVQRMNRLLLTENQSAE